MNQTLKNKIEKIKFKKNLKTEWSQPVLISETYDSCYELETHAMEGKP